MSDEPAIPRVLPAGLRVFLRLNASMTALCLAIEALCAALGWPEVYRTPFFVGLRFFDLDCFLERFQDLHTSAFFGPPAFSLFTYPAPAAVFYALFYSAGPGPALNVFLAVCAALVVTLLAFFALALARRGAARMVILKLSLGVPLLAFPLWFCLQRANLELLVFLLLACGLWGFCTGRPALAMLCFALAGTVKIVPLLWLALFVHRKQWLYLLGGLALAAVVTALSTAWVGPTYHDASAGLARGLLQFTQDYIQHPRVEAVGFDHSLVGVTRLVFAQRLAAGQIVRPYLLVAAIAGACLFVFRIRKLPLLNQVLCLAAAALVLPPSSFEYTLLHLYLGFGVLAFAALDGVHETIPSLALLGLLTAPLSEFIHHGVRFGGQIQALLLLLLLVMALVTPIPSRFDRQLAP